MALDPDDTRPAGEQQQPSDTTTAAEPPKKFPKGVVLGKDGKPWAPDPLTLDNKAQLTSP